jgi:hypothetical protein
MSNMLLDADGENQPLRAFLLAYGGGQNTIEGMRTHLQRSGYRCHWPHWASEGEGHLTKMGAQNWIRHLIAMEHPDTIQVSRAEYEALRRDAERWRGCAAIGKFPVHVHSGVSGIPPKWEVFKNFIMLGVGDTPEAAADAAINMPNGKGGE